MTELENTSASGSHEYVAFHVGDEDYCVDIMSVRELRGWSQATRLPHAPDFVYGVINLRGAVIPVIDLAARLGLGKTEPSARHVIIILQLGEQTLGLLVDAVSEILSATEDQLRPTPNVDSEAALEFVNGLILVEERMIRLVNLERVSPQPRTEAA